MKKEINFYLRNEEYGWLSNFERCFQVLDGEVYDTNEHYYQSQKTTNEEIRDWIENAPNPYLAMQVGRSLRKGKELRDDWEKVKVEIMLKGLRAKFEDKLLRKKLLETGDAVLHEGSPTNPFWGKRGKDMLGKLLMQVREEIRKEGEIK